MGNIDKKIKYIIKKLRKAHQESEKHYAKDFISEKPLQPHDIYKMGLAFDKERKIKMELELVRSERYPNYYTNVEIKNIKNEIEKLSYRIKSWKNRKFPHKTL